MGTTICALIDYLSKCLNGQSQQFLVVIALDCQTICVNVFVTKIVSAKVRHSASRPHHCHCLQKQSASPHSGDEERRGGDPPSCHCHALARHVWRVEGFYTEKRCLASSVANPPRNAWSAGPSLVQYFRLVVYFRHSSASLITGEPQCPSLISAHWYLMEDGPASSVD